MKKIIKIILVFIKVRYFQKFKTREELEEYQEKNLKKQLDFFKKNSPYFKNNNLEKNNFFMNKEFMMNNFDELNTVGVKKEEALKIAIEGEEKRNFEKKYKNISVGLSSGTSGHRGLFITTEEEQAVWAGTVLAKMLPKGLQKHRLAFFLRAYNDLYKAIDSYFIKLEYFDTFESIEKHIKKLNLYKPTILIAPASMLTILAKYQKENKIKISPKKIISVAEVLEERDREYIKESFNIKIIHEIYQATEGFLACTCKYGNLHLNEDIIKFEKNYIDEQKDKKRFYPIITDFERTSQPFIKYHLNDILVENNERCKCGSVFQRIEKIEGRSDDIFKFKNKNGELINIFPDFIRRCLLFVENIREYQVCQISFNEIEISVLDISDEQKIKILCEFKKLFKSFSVENIKINFVDYNFDRKVKLKRIQKKIFLK